MELTIRPEDLRPGATLVDVLALLEHGADAAAASAAALSPADPVEGSAPVPAPRPRPDEDGRVPGAMVEGPQPPIEIPGQLALPLMMAGASAGPAPAVASPAPSCSAPSPATPSAPSPAPASSPAEPLPKRAELIGLARTALQGGRRDAVKVLLERAGVKRMSEIPDETLTDAIEELKELLS